MQKDIVGLKSKDANGNRTSDTPQSQNAGSNSPAAQLGTTGLLLILQLQLEQLLLQLWGKCEFSFHH